MKIPIGFLAFLLLVLEMPSQTLVAGNQDGTEPRTPIRRRSQATKRTISCPKLPRFHLERRGVIKL